ncbi:MAG: methyltransferase [Prevotellaceae bacterium]|jgi:tRNA1Val (adenine37-N6)-methyltransferase|nr:methyltransferase [Prevotellaceae bacterium]
MFRFKQFSIQQDRCAMKVGTDGVLLGAWADCRNARRILDIGTGTGLIALMLAQRCPAVIDAVEIDKNAAEQALENVQRSPWAERVRIINASFQDFCKTATTRYDLVVSNPPYFHRSLKSPTIERSFARHSDTLPFDEIIEGSKKLLSEKGKLTVILPLIESVAFTEKALSAGFFCGKKCLLTPRPGAETKRVLLSFGKENQACQHSELLIETATRHCYSEQYRELTKDFYLGF